MTTSLNSFPHKKPSNLDNLSHQKVVQGATKGLIIGFLFSLNPLLIFFFNQRNNQEAAILLAFFMTFWESLTSFVGIAILLGTKSAYQHFFHNNKKIAIGKVFLCYITILPIFWILLMGICKVFAIIISQLHDIRTYLIIFVSFLSGPFGLALIMVANVLMNNDGTLSNILSSLSPIPTVIVSRFLLKERIKRYRLWAMLLTMISVVCLVIHYIIAKQYLDNPIQILGIFLAAIVSLFYASDITTMSYLMHRSKNEIKWTTYFVIKVFFSGIIMFLIVIPIVSVILGFHFYTGWTLFSIFKTQTLATQIFYFGSIAWIIFAYGAIEAVARLLHYSNVKLTTGSYAITFIVCMLIWTPILQLIGYSLLKNFGYTISSVPWYYWFWSTFIGIGLIWLSFGDIIIDRWKTRQKKLKLQQDKTKN